MSRAARIVHHLIDAVGAVVLLAVLVGQVLLPLALGAMIGW